MRKRLLTLICAIIVLTVSLTGCMQFKATFYMDNEYMNKAELVMVFNETLFNNIPQENKMGLESLDDLLAILSMNDFSKDKNTVVTALSYNEKGDNFKGYRYEFTPPDNEGISLTEAFDEDGLKIIPLGNNQYGCELDFKQTGSGGFSADSIKKELESMNMTEDQCLEEFSKSGMIMQISIKTNNKVISHNADQVINGDEYVWDIMKAMVSGQKMKAFIVYQLGNSETIVKAPNREEFITKYNLDPKDPDFYGKALQSVNVLYGTDKGLDLDSDLLRLQGALVYARLLGLDEKIEVFAKTNPNYDSGFTDVPDWAKKTMNYLHYKKLVFGTGNNLYGSEDPMSEAQFTALVLRALGYSEANKDFVFIDAPYKANSIGFYFTDNSGYDISDREKLTRRDMSYIAYSSLFIQNKARTAYLMDNLSVTK